MRNMIDSRLNKPQFRLCLWFPTQKKIGVHIKEAGLIMSKDHFAYKDYNKVKVNLTSNGVMYLIQSSTSNLQELYLNENLIGNKGCKYLTKAKWQKLIYLCLNQNHIDAVGINHLSKGRWQKLQAMILMGNNLNCDSVKLISKGNYINLHHLSLTNRFLKGMINENSATNSHEMMQLLLSHLNYLEMLWINGSANKAEWEIRPLKKFLQAKFTKSGVFLR